MYQSTKTYEPGFSCAFRQWRADSHCRLIHGYALSFKFVFEAEQLDERNWVVDFGGLGLLKARLEAAFDHKLLIAEDDPNLDALMQLRHIGVLDPIIMPTVGCEAFAEFGYGLAWKVLNDTHQLSRVRIVSVECREHGANSAIYIPTNVFGAK